MSYGTPEELHDMGLEWEAQREYEASEQGYDGGVEWRI
jgi:hypothetical protein